MVVPGFPIDLERKLRKMSGPAKKAHKNANPGKNNDIFAFDKLNLLNLIF